MKFRWILMGLLLVVLSPVWAFSAENFPSAPKDGAKCTYEEVGGGKGPGPRTFRVKCAVDKKTYTCDYRGNPHNCPWYVQDVKKNPPKFYAKLAEIAARYDTACTAKYLEDRKNCEGVKMEKE